MNTNFISPNNVANPKKEYCYRDEIMHPQKLALIPDKCYDIYSRFDSYYYVIRVPWNRRYRSYGVDVQTSHFYVLCQHPRMFSLANNDRNPERHQDKDKDKNQNLDLDLDLYFWFKKYGDSMFLVSNVVLVDNTVLHSYYICDEKGQCHDLDGVDNELDFILDNHYYTVGNGLTYLLGQHRLSPNTVYIYDILEDSITHDYYQDVSRDWEQIYYGTRESNIADYPLYYVCQGPDFASEEILDLFMNQCLTLTIVSTPRTAMFPHFSPSHWYGTSTYMDNRTYDIHGLLSTFLYTTTSFDFLLENPKVLDTFFQQDDVYQQIIKFIDSTSHMYEHGINTDLHIDIVRERIGNIWKDVFTRYCDKNGLRVVIICAYLQKYVIENTYMPLALLKVVLKLLHRKALIYKTNITGNISRNSFYRILNIFPNAEIFAFPTTRYKLTTSLYAMFQLDKKHIGYIHKCIATRLLCLKTIINKKNTENGNIVFDCVKFYLQEHRYLLL